jgi:hypothetical protein
MNVSMTLDIVPISIGASDMAATSPDYKSAGNATAATTNVTSTMANSANSTTHGSLTPLVAAVIDAQDADGATDSHTTGIHHMPIYVVKRQTLEEGRADISRHFVEAFNSRYSRFFTMNSINTGLSGLSVHDECAFLQHSTLNRCARFHW